MTAPATPTPPASAARAVDDSAALPFVVLCPKFDGTRREFKRCATRGEATAIAQALQRQGCAAHVEEFTGDVPAP